MFTSINLIAAEWIFMNFYRRELNWNFCVSPLLVLSQTEIRNTVCDGPHVSMQSLSMSCLVDVGEDCFEQM